MIAPIVITILFCVGMLMHVASEEKRERQARIAEAKAKIREAGFFSDGDPFEQAQIGVSADGIDSLLHTQCERPLPGKTGAGRTVCLVSLNVEGPDMLICRKSDSDEIMGPLPTALRFPLGDAIFDEEYVAYAGGEVSGGKESGYRGGPERPPISWAQPAILRRLQDFGLIWLRVRDGEAEIAFQPVRYKRALAILRLARIIALGARNVDSDELPAVEEDAPPLPTEVTYYNLGALIALVVMTVPFGSLLSLTIGSRHIPVSLGTALVFTVDTAIITLITLVQWRRRKA